MYRILSVGVAVMSGVAGSVQNSSRVHLRVLRAPLSRRTQCGVVARSSGLPLQVVGDVPASVDIPAGRHWQILIKRVLDVAISIILLAVLAPFLLVTASVIKLTSKGDVLFRQKREGLGGAPIEIIKFRSMYLDRCDITGVNQTKKDDPRVTPIGRIIRHFNIDEVPQLFNVIRGDMSLVGPRPHAFGMRAGGRLYEDLVPYYHLRHSVVKPGLTGWAQANGLRGPTDDPASARARIDHDIAYIQNFSLWLDVRIMVKTLRREFFGGSGC